MTMVHFSQVCFIRFFLIGADWNRAGHEKYQGMPDIPDLIWIDFFRYQTAKRFFEKDFYGFV